MSYANAADLLDATPEHLVAQLTGTDEPDETAIERALADASAEIDGYIAARYALPLLSVPPVLQRICVDIAVYRLMNLRPLGDIDDARRRYEDAIRFLKDLVKHDVSLPLPDGDSAADVSGVAFTPGTSVFKDLGYWR